MDAGTNGKETIPEAADSAESSSRTSKSGTSGGVNTLPVISISAGELCDRITILFLKIRHSRDAEKSRRLIEEYEVLLKAQRELVASLSELDQIQIGHLYAYLLNTNERLWELEDKVRALIAAKARANWSPDDHYVYSKVAVNIPILNDARHASKSAIDSIINPGIGELKFYTERVSNNAS